MGKTFCAGSSPFIRTLSEYLGAYTGYVSFRSRLHTLWYAPFDTQSPVARLCTNLFTHNQISISRHIYGLRAFSVSVTYAIVCALRRSKPCCLSLHQSIHSKLNNKTICGYGEIGRRAGFRFLWVTPCGFESLYPHHFKNCRAMRRFFILDKARRKK